MATLQPSTKNTPINGNKDDPRAQIDNAVSQGGAYEIIRKRLVDQARSLNTKVASFNAARLEEFGDSKMDVLARIRVRTENNCIARDIVQVGDTLLFGYNVFIGLKKETKREDVFALFSIKEDNGEFDMQACPIEGSFLDDTSFVNDFDELYRYYKNTKLIQLTIMHGKLLAAFQIGEKLEDIRVFRWTISSDGQELTYIDNRGERDIQLPPPYDFEWIDTTRDDIVNGRHAHINILDTVFIETIDGSLTLKIENNTEDGVGIYSEEVVEKSQSINDAKFRYAQVGKLILLEVLPYREETSRYLVFNTLTNSVNRIDAIGESCVQLPEDHGIIFPGGYYLENGECKTFTQEYTGLKFKRSLRSPNGEDVLFVFYEQSGGVIGLFSYNLIEKNLKNPIYGHGYALFDNGRIVIFSSDVEPARTHPMQIWETPFQSSEYVSNQEASQTFLGKIGNPDLVRGISDLYSITRMIDSQTASMKLYEELVNASKKLFDDHYWIEDQQSKGIDQVIKEISATAELVIDEFEKVVSIRQQSTKAIKAAQKEQQTLLVFAQSENWKTPEEYVEALRQLRKQRGHLATVKNYRYIDLALIDELDKELVDVIDDLSEQTVKFLADETALEPYYEKIKDIDQTIEKARTIAELAPFIEQIEKTASGLDLLSELMNSLKIDDTTVRTRIIDAISNVYSKLNQSKAHAKHKQKGLGSSETIAQFSAQFKLFTQSITNALGLSNTPDKCDEQLARLLVQLEELESQFSDHEEFLADIFTKREEIYSSFEAHKQNLLDERQKKSQSVNDAANRILSSIDKRSKKFTQAEELNTYFAADTLIAKIRELVARLRELGSAVQADDIESKLKSIKEQAIRSLRDKTDIYEDNGKIIKLGPKHKFSVNIQELDLTILPRNGRLFTHLTGTDFYEEINDPVLYELEKYWNISLESETPQVYRSEFLAASILNSAQQKRDNLSIELLNEAHLDHHKLMNIVKAYATPRYKEGYEKGVHDHDATLILSQLIRTLSNADLLKFTPFIRGLAQFFWANINLNLEYKNTVEYSCEKTWTQQAQSAKKLSDALESKYAFELIAKDINRELGSFFETFSFNISQHDRSQVAQYLALELSRDELAFTTSRSCIALFDEFKRSVNDETWKHYQATVLHLERSPTQGWQLSEAWLNALIAKKSLHHLAHFIPETIGYIHTHKTLPRREIDIDLTILIEGLLGEHTLIKNRILTFSADSFLQRMEHHKSVVIPSYRRYLDTRKLIAKKQKQQLRLDEFKPKPLSSFVRNKLINDAYLPIIGANLAKQMGTVGDDKRTDLMGLLMMISPPGYGKTTLMEYVASRLGLIFMKINCPSLGHDVLSLDPAQAPNATAKQELDKLNLGLEMGNNVMLYLDDIQHTHPEFLQKFISLCDGTRRIEGVWKGQTQTYDMRGKKFCVVMAGNPYTESGEAFKVPDMLANRADIYNLGDILGGMDDQFALSYIENALTSNAVLAPLAIRDLDDVYRFTRMAKGESIANTEFSHQYSGAEMNEITQVLKKLFVIQDVVLKINLQYIASAAQNDKYRIEPPFKLQGSYRNMNKMAEKVSSVMNDAELMSMIEDHYLGESQLLTSGAEDNLLKLAELRGNITDTQQKRWKQIKNDFLKNKAMGGDDADTGQKVVGQLVDISKGLTLLGEASQSSNQELQAIIQGLHASSQKNSEALVSASMALQKETDLEPTDARRSEKSELISGLTEALEKLDSTMEHSPELTDDLLNLADQINTVAKPLIKQMDKKLAIDLRMYFKVSELSKKILALKKENAKNKAK